MRSLCEFFIEFFISQEWMVQVTLSNTRNQAKGKLDSLSQENRQNDVLWYMSMHYNRTKICNRLIVTYVCKNFFLVGGHSLSTHALGVGGGVGPDAYAGVQGGYSHRQVHMQIQNILVSHNSVTLFPAGSSYL